MVSEYAKEELIRMHKELTDDDFIAENIRKNKVERIKKDKRADTGL